MSEIAQFPHCDQRILHAPSECEFCDGHPEWQELRKAWGIAFTGYRPRITLPECGKKVSRPGLAFSCRQARGHDGDCLPVPEHEALPCPADAARPPGSGSDHRRWGGNKPTSAKGNPSWPAETAASRMMYGDMGGRAAGRKNSGFLLKITAAPAGVQALFLGLKLSGAVRWPWWAVLAPAWVTAACLVVGGGIVFAALGTWGRQ